jgi:hypothetical protein
MARLMFRVSPKASDALDERLSRLKVTLDAFNKAFPQVSKESTGSSAFSWRSLSQTVLRLKSQHDSKYESGFYGKSKRTFHSVCSKINDHTNVLKILPQGEKYVAPICGSLELIFKVSSVSESQCSLNIDPQASVNYEHVGEEFGESLKEIDDIVRSVRKELSLCQGIDVTGWAIELCCYIIEFLAFPFQWYTQNAGKRLRASLNEHLADKYKGPVKQIRRLSKLIQRNLDVQTAERVAGLEKVIPLLSASIQEARLYQKYYRWTDADELPAKYVTALEQHRNILKNNQDELLVKMSELLEHKKIGMLFRPLADREVSRFFEERASYMSESVVRAQEEDCQPFGSRSVSGQLFETEGEVVVASNVLDVYFDMDQIRPEMPVENIFIEGKAARALQSWTADRSAAFLGIFGPSTTPHQDPARMLMSNYIRVAAASGILCISYFCDITHEAPPAGRTRETVGLTQLMYALLKQLVGHLPARLPYGHSLSRARFDALDGTLSTWPAALTLFEELVAMAASPYLLFAIYGIEQLEDAHTAEPLESMMATFRRLNEVETKGPKLKILFTTSGKSQVLGDCLNQGEVCDISRGSTARKPGKSGKGRRRVADDEFDEE